MPNAKTRLVSLLAAALFVCAGAGVRVAAQGDGQDRRGVEPVVVNQGSSGPATPVTIPITIRPRNSKAQRELQAVDFSIREDGDVQQILSVRRYGTGPLSVAILIQDNVVPSISNEIRSLAEFIRHLPRGSRVLVGYIKAGSLEVRQKFTPDLERAARALRVPIGSTSAAPFNPYVEISEGLKRFESQPAGRRSMLVVSDGLDTSRGFDLGSITRSIDEDRAINQAQRLGVAIYSFYAPTVGLSGGRNQLLTGAAQGSLQKLSDQTGGRAFFQGLDAPVSFDPFLRELDMSLASQVALTYLSTHTGKGFHRIQIKSGTPGMEIDHPSGYTR